MGQYLVHPYYTKLDLLNNTCFVTISYSFLCTAMVIGFTHRFQTVSESNALYREDFFPVNIPVATLRTAERVHPIVYRLQVSDSTAIVEPTGDLEDPLFDVVFGTSFGRYDPIDEEFDLRRLEDNIPPLSAQIRNNLRPEDEECFTMGIFPIDIPGRRELFSCNEDNEGAVSYFCKTTICIEDNDGRCVTKNYNFYKFIILQSHLELHLWKKHTLLMRVWVQ